MISFNSLTWLAAIAGRWTARIAGNRFTAPVNLRESQLQGSFFLAKRPFGLTLSKQPH